MSIETDCAIESSAIEGSKVTRLTESTEPYEVERAQAPPDASDRHRRCGSAISGESIAEEAPIAPIPIHHFGELVGRSPAMFRLFEELAQIAPSDSTVLVQGETGSGKDLVAQEIHKHSTRRDGPFVVVDCGGLPDTLIEAELFGHERGAFTGADRSRPGAFEMARGGTLFLDEIGELPLAMQTKLLRVLDARKVKRLGSNEWREVDVRVIAATHQSLAQRANQRLFRKDLYFRLAVLNLRVPPLRERLDDLPLLIRSILEEKGALDALVIDEPLLAVLRSQTWSGNVRELRNVIERSLILGVDALASDDSDVDNPSVAGEERFKVLKALAVERFEKKYLLDLLERYKGNIAAASRAGRINKAWIFQLVRRYGISVQEIRHGKLPLRAAR